MEKIALSCREGGVMRRVENHGPSQHRRWPGSSGEAGWWLRLGGLQARGSHFPTVSGLACCPRPHRSFLLRKSSMPLYSHHHPRSRPSHFCTLHGQAWSGMNPRLASLLTEHGSMLSVPVSIRPGWPSSLVWALFGILGCPTASPHHSFDK